MYQLFCLIAFFSTASGFSLLKSHPLRNVHIDSKQPSCGSIRQDCSFSRNRNYIALSAADVEGSNDIETKAIGDGEGDDEDDWEFEEYENLLETDFYDSEWKVGTLMDGGKKIEETWTRLIVKDGEFICVWGDGSNGKWNFDPASQFLSMSKDTIGGWLGKRIWAGTVDDFYYVQGTIRGWSPISPASVIGQWQAKRLGVDKDEAGIAPWLQEDEEEEDEAKDESAEKDSEE